MVREGLQLLCRVVVEVQDRVDDPSESEESPARAFNVASAHSRRPLMALRHFSVSGGSNVMSRAIGSTSWNCSSGQRMINLKKTVPGNLLAKSLAMSHDPRSMKVSINSLATWRMGSSRIDSAFAVNSGFTCLR